MLKTRTVFLLFLIGLNYFSFSQGRNNWWYLGYQSVSGPPTGGIEMNFNAGAPVINYISRPMDLNRTHTNISDSLGNMLFYTNGYYIADATNDTMQNGSNIGPTAFIQSWPYGLTVPQAALIIPKPGSNNIYYLFHNTLDNAPYFNKSHHLYLTVIDMSMNGGLGAITIKNFTLLMDTLNPGKITACKHANGRDWWVICQRQNSNRLHKLLVTPSGVNPITYQDVGSIRQLNASQACFSPDGTYYADYYTTDGLDLFGFDRCSGTFTFITHVPTGNYNNFVGGGVAFSPNSQVVYISDVNEVYQYDLNAANIAASEQLIAVWDSTYSPNPPFATLFENAELAPDGKIYITTGNSTFQMHVINNPDSLGTSCDLVQHGITLPAFYFNTLPNHPNYFLGSIPGSSCDTITSIQANISEITLKAYPNPSDGMVTLSFDAQEITGTLEIYNSTGKIILNELISPWSQIKKIDLSAFSSGVYFCKLQWENTHASIKILRQ